MREEFLAAAAQLDTGSVELGEPGAITWYPDRSWHGHTYVPGTLATASDTSCSATCASRRRAGERAARRAAALVDFTEETAERNPDWRMDLCEEVIGSWRGQFGAVASMTLVWGRPLVSGGRIVTAELADMAVDQCELVDERFTLIAPDDYRHDLLEIKLFDLKGRELARESLYTGEEDGGGEE